MEIILLGIYSFFVWLIFIKLKLLPWTTPWKVAVVIFPVVVLAFTILLLNIFAPTTTDVRERAEEHLRALVGRDDAVLYDDQWAAISALAVDLKDRISELDINPLFVFPEGHGVKAVDALIRLKG